MNFIKTTIRGGFVVLMPAMVRGVGRRDCGESGHSRYTTGIDALDETCVALHGLRLTL